MLTKYENPKVKLHTPLNGVLMLDSQFVPLFDNFVLFAASLDIEIYVIRGYAPNSDHISGAVYTPASRSNHFIGCAVDVNFIYKGIHYNYDKLKDHAQIPAAIMQLINHWKLIGYRWGGDFHADRNGKRDEVHFDDGTNILHPAIWDAKYKEYHA